MTDMIVKIKEVPENQKPVLERIIQLYLYDFSALQDANVNRDGFFEHDMRLDSYWSEPDRFPFLIFVNSEIVGFVLINSYVCLVENNGARSIAEFFVMRNYRRRGVGKSAAFQIFDRFPGKWEVREIEANAGGQKFWRKVIKEYTRGTYTETSLKNDLWHGPVQCFESGR